MLEYKIIRHEIKFGLLVKEVNEHLNSGWEPLGGISAIVVKRPQKDVDIYIQALIKKT